MSREKNKLTQTDYLLLDYELTIERKALSRAIHDIEDEHLGIFTNPKGGTWYDENGYEYE